MQADFPNNPVTNQQFSIYGVTYIYDGLKWVVQTPEMHATAALNNAGRNYIHNPMFNIQQRGAGPWTTTATYTADRWVLNLAMDTASVSVVAMTDADRAAIGDDTARYYLQNVFTGNAATNAFNQVVQFIEDVRRLAGKTVTISFWAKAATAGLKLAVVGNQNFGTGGSPSAVVNWPVPQAVPITTTWARYSVTYPIPSVAGKTLGTNGDDRTALQFGFSAGANTNAAFGNIGVQSGNIKLWGIQLEAANTATQLEMVHPGEDLRRCQRFYQTGTIGIEAYQNAASALRCWALLPTVMRTIPTVVLTPLQSTNCGAPIADGHYAGGFRYAVTATASGPTGSYSTFTASADL